MEKIMDNCLFCKIVSGDIPSTKVYEDDKILAFRDISPQAPTHILVIPKEHIAGVDELNADNSAVVSHIFMKIAEIARQEGLSGGYLSPKATQGISFPPKARIASSHIPT